MNTFGGGYVNVIVNGPDPGSVGGGEEFEATLDATWSSAIAPNATVDFVVSGTTNTTDGIDLSELYIVENNLADIMTESFGSCEYFATDARLQEINALAEQAAAQGITYFVSSGDNGAEGCDSPSNPPAKYPVSVSALASTAFNVAVGGTMFNESGTPSKYWASTAAPAETALSYIPENVWNQSSATGTLGGQWRRERRQCRKQSNLSCGYDGRRAKTVVAVRRWTQYSTRRRARRAGRVADLCRARSLSAVLRRILYSGQSGIYSCLLRQRHLRCSSFDGGHHGPGGRKRRRTTGAGELRSLFSGCIPGGTGHLPVAVQWLEYFEPARKHMHLQ